MVRCFQCDLSYNILELPRLYIYCLGHRIHASVISTYGLYIQECMMMYIHIHNMWPPTGFVFLIYIHSMCYIFGQKNTSVLKARKQEGTISPPIRYQNN